MVNGEEKRDEEKVGKVTIEEMNGELGEEEAGKYRWEKKVLREGRNG